MRSPTAVNSLLSVQKEWMGSHVRRVMESREEFVADLLEGGLELVSPSVLLMNRGFDTEAVRGVCERSGVTYLTGRRTGEHTRIDRPAAGGVDVFRDRELSLYEERTTLYERADSDEVDTTFAADDDEEEDDQTRQEGLRQEFDDALNIDSASKTTRKNARRGRRSAISWTTHRPAPTTRRTTCRRRTCRCRTTRRQRSNVSSVCTRSGGGLSPPTGQ